jgi:heterodisulfide reductase subunit A-like polyferredoxin/coenzyme F420-reducing hydrogenase delta subunit
MTDMQTMPTKETEVNTRVLVIGGAWSGALAAAELTALGYGVTLVEEAPALDKARELSDFYTRLVPERDKPLLETARKVDDMKDIELLTSTTVLNVRGMPGDFKVKLNAGGQVRDVDVGAVVVATDIEARPAFEIYGLSPDSKAIGLSELESREPPGDATVAFVVGFCDEGSPLSMERIMRSALKVQEAGSQAYVYVRNIKVAADGLEQLYKDTRDRGVLYFKLHDRPELASDGSNLVFQDPVLSQNVELNPDLVVVEDQLAANHQNQRLAELLRIDLGPGNFIQENNVHRFPVQSNREGIFVVGGSRDVASLPDTCVDVGNLVLEVSRFLNNGVRSVPEHMGIVDREKCCFCLTCYRCCPHGAITWEDKPVISSMACQGCGICASECPQDAIQIVSFEDDSIKQAIKAHLAKTAAGPSIIAFCCENSALEAGHMAEAFNRGLPAGLNMIKVPCAGKVDLDYIFTAFLSGADGVMILSCHPGNCKSVRGNTFAGWRVESAYGMLENAGMSPGRLTYATLASNMDVEFSELVTGLEARLKDLGPSPLK